VPSLALSSKSALPEPIVPLDCVENCGFAFKPSDSPVFLGLLAPFQQKLIKYFTVFK
jgi:hypothetical protein